MIGRNIGRAALFAWELPQNTLGAALFVIEAMTGSIAGVRFERERLMIESKGVAVSLGLLVFWCRRSNRWHDLDERNRDHEWGHSIQSRWLGPLYLPVVGVPSALRSLYAFTYREITGRKWQGYYDGFPERQADRLGGVVR
jgi:NADH:ubiquinone oxidoreductase subunit K